MIIGTSLLLCQAVASVAYLHAWPRVSGIKPCSGNGTPTVSTEFIVLRLWHFFPLTNTVFVIRLGFEVPMSTKTTTTAAATTTTTTTTIMYQNQYKHITEVRQPIYGINKGKLTESLLAISRTQKGICMFYRNHDRALRWFDMKIKPTNPYKHLKYIILCYVMLFYVTLYYTILYYTILHYTMKCYEMLCYVMLCYVMLCYVILRYITLCYIILYYIILYYIILYYIILYYIILYYIILYYKRSKPPACTCFGHCHDHPQESVVQKIYYKTSTTEIQNITF